MFFQVALLAGYAYTDFTTRKLKPRTQVIVHVVLLLVSLAVLPILADVSWKPQGNEDPGARILGLLIATIGLPYLLLATTGPLVQAWFARSFPMGTVYRVFALSNLAAMLALISYPFIFETWIATASQAVWWSAGYTLFAVLCATSAIVSLRHGAAAAPAATATESSAPPDDAPAPRRVDLILWLSLSAMGSWLLLAITNHITQNIASIPFLWLAPLTLYLLTFILCFESDGWYKRGLILGPLAIILGFCAWGLQTSSITLDIKIAIPLYLAGLFFCCMFFHGELAKMRPAPRYLTQFYLMVSLGGALGGMVAGGIGAGACWARTGVGPANGPGRTGAVSREFWVTCTGGSGSSKSRPMKKRMPSLMAASMTKIPSTLVARGAMRPETRSMTTSTRSPSSDKRRLIADGRHVVVFVLLGEAFFVGMDFGLI